MDYFATKTRQVWDELKTRPQLISTMQSFTSCNPIAWQ